MLEKIKQVLENNTAITFVLLFGSFASGKENSLSDVDIGIFTEKEIDLLEMGGLISELEFALDRRVDLVLLNDVYKKNPKLGSNILDNHEVVFCKDEKKFIDFKTNVMKYYLDVKPMYDMFDEAFRERVDNGTVGKTKTS